MELKQLQKFKYVRNKNSYMDEDKFDKLEVREEFIEELKRLEKEPTHSFKTMEELDWLVDNADKL